MNEANIQSATQQLSASAKSPKTSLSELRNTDLVSRLLAATPPYLYNIPLTPNSFFFSEMLRSLVQAKAENSNRQNCTISGGVHGHQKRARKRSWTQSARASEFQQHQQHLDEGIGKERPLELTMGKNNCGSVGNLSGLVSVVRKPAMRTPRNMYIVNLAVSDLLLCTVTMPLTLMEVLTKYWPLGNYTILCQMKNTLQTVSVFVTAMTIAAIALDRYRVIVYPTRESPNLSWTGLNLLTIWLVTLLLASPMFTYTKLAHHEVKINGTDLSLDFCIEDWPFQIGRIAYTVFALIFQYLVPIIILSGAYLSIYLKLKYRFATGFVSNEASQNAVRRQTRGRRLKRTNILLVSITVIFCISWLPLHVFNLIADTTDEFYDPVPYAVCHMMSMSSACSNPVLYGWLNENFWKEFKDIFCLNSSNDDTEKKRSVARRPSRNNPDGQERNPLKVPRNCDTEMTNFTTS